MPPTLTAATKRLAPEVARLHAEFGRSRAEGDRIAAPHAWPVVEMIVEAIRPAVREVLDGEFYRGFFVHGYAFALMEARQPDYRGGWVAPAVAAELLAMRAHMTDVALRGSDDPDRVVQVALADWGLLAGRYTVLKRASLGVLRSHLYVQLREELVRLHGPDVTTAQLAAPESASRSAGSKVRAIEFMQ
jgi:hypothetical protein